MSADLTPSGLAAAESARRGVEFRALYHKLEDALARIERAENVSLMLESIVALLVSRFEAELGFEGGRIYRREGEDFVLCCGIGTSRDVPLGIRVPRDYPPHLRTLSSGLVVMRHGEAGYDPQFERTIGVRSHFAAITVGEGSSHVIAFSIRGEVREEHVLYSLTAVRHVINLKLEQQRVHEIFEQSRLIQESLLPGGPPDFAGFDIAGQSRPAESVGGDLFDYLPLGGDRLGIAIADSSGHGLPAALLARDVVTGLRMGVGDHTGIPEVIERLNRVIHRAALATKFASLFYGELRADGRLEYCNAGHNPPLWRRGRTLTELDRGGTVLGPIPTARYESTEIVLHAGDALLLYTDGVVDRENRRGVHFGVERLRRLLREFAGAGAKQSVYTILSAVDAHAQGSPAHDDMTVVVVRRI
jgi:sigma-B regulation protein RsbU (phosphoserine phosphatase)